MEVPTLSEATRMIANGQSSVLNVFVFNHCKPDKKKEFRIALQLLLDEAKWRGAQ